MRAFSGKRIGDSHLSAALVSSAASLATKIAAAGAGVLLTYLIAHRFGAAGSGTWVLATTILQIAGYVGLCGLDYGTTRAIAVFASQERWSAARAWIRSGVLLVAVAGGLTSLLLLLARGPLSTLLSEPPTFADMLLPVSLAVIPYGLMRLAAGSLRGLRRFVASDALENGVMPAALSLIMLIVGIQRLTDLAYGYLAVSIAAAAAGLGAWRRTVRGKPTGVAPLMLQEALTRSLPLAGTVLATLASPWIVTLSLGGAATTAEVGVYRVALQFALLLGFLLNAVETGLSPQIAALHSHHKLADLAHTAKRLTLLLIVLGGIPSLILFTFAETFLSIFGPEFPQGATALRVLIAAQMVNLATGPVGSFMVMTGLERISFRNAVMGTILVLILSALLIPVLGTVGAAIASASATVFRNLIATYYVWNRHGLLLPVGLVRDRGSA